MRAEAKAKECLRPAALSNLANTTNATASITEFKDQSGIHLVHGAMNHPEPEWDRICSETDTNRAAERKNRFERLAKDEDLRASI